MKLYNHLCCAAALGISAIFLGAAVPASAAVIGDDVPIQSGVSILNRDLSGVTVGEARELIENDLKTLASTGVTIQYGTESSTISLYDLGISWDTESSVQTAASYGTTGSLITRYKAQTDLKHENISVPVKTSYNAASVKQQIEQIAAERDTPAEDATLSREDGEFIVHEGHSGVVTDIDATVAALTALLDQGLTSDMTVEASAVFQEPEVTTEMLAAIQDKLGTYTTDYSSSSYNRKTNVSVAAGRLNGQILMPGESLSVSDTILSRSPENGYLMAPQYANGVTEDSYGGGVCQVSTTLYNAVIRAELQVETRYPHSMIVHYVPYASDAAISEGNKDFVFSNNTEYPIYIASYADGETLIFSIYGKETRPENRSIEFVSKTLSEEYPEDKVELDENEPEGFEEETGSRSPEVTATLTKVVYENGVEVSRTLMHTDTYDGTSKTIRKGTKKTEETEEETTREESTTEKETTKAPETTTERETTRPAETTTEMIDPPEDDEYDEEETQETKKKKKKETTEADEPEDDDDED